MNYSAGAMKTGCSSGKDAALAGDKGRVNPAVGALSVTASGLGGCWACAYLSGHWGTELLKAETHNAVSCLWEDVLKATGQLGY